MSTFGAFWMVNLLLAAYCGHAQANTSRPRFNPEQAIAVASNLSLGMRENEAIRLLESTGLKAPMRVGCSHGWTCFYDLVDGSRLGLAMAPTRARADGAWANGLLRAAYIQRQGSNLAIALQPGLLPQADSARNEDWELPVVVLVATCVVFAVAIVAITRKAKTWNSAARSC
jgi:hypothetical protein